MLIIGESINASIKPVAEAINQRDGKFVADLARRQVEAGADMLDVNAGAGMRDEAHDLIWLVQTVQSAIEIPLVLDSSNPEALVKVYPECKQRPMLSSLTLEPHCLEVLLPFIKEHDCQVLGMCLGGGTMPKTAEDVFAMAKVLLRKTGEAGLKPEDFYIDVAVMAIAANTKAALKVLDSIRLIKAYEPKVNTVCAVSNVSFGLPRRKLLNRTFIPMLAGAGANAFIIDVRDKDTIAAVIATKALLGYDDFCMNYMRAYRQEKI
ncbi:MAG: dihydropteroate synthase [Dehalococcoidales bacterium]|nr:dihydropteroate synthase [Dehalococcoidales bacterium]